MTAREASSEPDDAPARVIIAVVGLDQHEMGSVIVARILRDAGMEVIYLGRFNTPASVVEVAVAEDADVVGVSCHSWEFLEFGPDLARRLAEHSIPLILGGSLLTATDSEQLRDAGVFAFLGPGSAKAEIVDRVRQAVDHRRRAG